jgi:hypothetical protein
VEFENTDTVHVDTTDIMLALARYHSAESVLDGDGPSGRGYGHGIGRADSSRGFPEVESHNTRLSMLILSKTYPFMVYLAMYLDLCRLFRFWVEFSAEKQQRVDP